VGANLGIQDGQNLAWKLAAVFQGYADSTLLSTYETERRHVAGFAAEQEEITDREKTTDNELQARFGFYASSAVLSDEEGITPDYTELKGQSGSRVPHLWVEYQGRCISTLDITVVISSCWQAQKGEAGNRLRGNVLLTLASNCPSIVLVLKESF